MLFRRALTRISPHNFIPDSYTKSLQLNLSTGFLRIAEEIQQNDSLIFQVYGEPGSGCSTLVQGLCRHLCEINYITRKEILYLSFDRHCDEKSLWDVMSDLAKEKNDKEHSTLFSATSVGKDEKMKVFLGLFNFKVVCLDNADCSEDFVESFLEHLVSCKIKTFVIGLHTKQIPMNGKVSRIEVRGLNLSAAQELFRKLCPSCAYEDRKISSLCGILKCNPVAIKIFCALVNSHQFDKHLENLLKDVNAYNSTKQLRDEKQVAKFALDWILDYIKQSLGPSNISILYQLCHLRRPLPVTELKPEVSVLIELNLLTVKKEGNVSFISIDSSLQKHLSHRKDNETVEKATDFSVLECWLSLVSTKLQGLVKDAEENAWPFVPEKWQYIQNVGKEENYNVKELLTSRNVHAGFLTELQILQECLYHAYIEGKFQKLAALVLVIDRFLYWQGEGKIAMDIVDFIQRTSPQTAIAPQLVIRRVRFMKSNGSLQEAEETLNKLLQAKSKIGQWKYRKEQDFHLVSGVCVQIKGEIQYRLGHWSKGAALLIQSIGFFGSLPQPDKKGLASSYVLLSLCLRNMTVTDYAVLAQSFGLYQCHPLLAAYFSGQEAAEKIVYVPMFFLRCKCQLGEVLLEFLNLIPDKNEKQHLLRIAIEDLKDSIQAHQSYASLTSREQFYLLVCAAYKISLALFQIGSNEDKEKGLKLKELSTELYEHYCSSNHRVPINNDVIGMVDQCLSLLGLEAFSQDNLPNAGEVLVEFFEKRKAVRQRENTSLSTVGFFDNLVKHQITPVPGVSKDTKQNRKSTLETEEQQAHQDEALDGTVNRCASTVETEEQQAHQDEALDGTVVRCASTVETEEQRAHQDETLDGAVDRCASTVETEEQRAHQDETLDGTVDRCASTVEMEEQQVHQDEALNGTVDQCTSTVRTEEQQAHQDEAPDGTVDRCASTVKTEEQQAHQDEAPDGTVDRCASTVKTEEQQAHQDEAPDGTVDRCASTVETEEQQAHQDEAPDGTVDRCASTVETEEQQAHQDEALDGTVDRCASTVKTEEQQAHQDEAPDGTVDRCASTVETEEQQAHQDEALDGTVDRCASTVETEEQQAHQDETLDGTVDRCASTVETEEQQAHQDEALDGTVDRCSSTVETEEQQAHQDEALDGTVDRCASTVETEEQQAHQDEAPDGTVDRCASTVETEEQRAHQDEAPDGTVDRCASTVETEEQRAHQDEAPDGTVDRCASTVETEEQQAHQDEAPDGTVDRCASTVETEEQQAHQDEAPDGTVDRCASTVETEEQQAHQDEALDGTVDRCSSTVETEEQQAHQDETLDGTVDRCASTVETEEQQAHQDEALDGTVDRCASTVEKEEQQAHQDEALDGTVDRCASTVEKEEQQVHQALSTLPQQLIFHTVDQQAQTNTKAMEDGGQEIVVQSLVDEAAGLPSKTMEPVTADKHSVGQQKAANGKARRAKDAILWKYDAPTSQWRGQPTMVYIGEQLKFAKGKEGAQRDVYTVEFINQDEQLGRYVAKCYRKKRTMRQYQNDVLSQMTAKQYVAWFNQQLYEAAAGVPVGDIQFLPVVLLQLVTSNGQTEIFNAEPYMSGEFIKLTNNTDWKNRHRRTDLVLAYSHFTYQASDGKLIIVDIQGWAPLDNQGCTYLTDPQIHSTVYKCFGTGNFGKEGYDNFWKMHSECNEICKMLGLKRPFNK